MATKEQIQAIMKLREDWQREDDQRDEKLPHVFEGIERVDDLQYGDDQQWNVLDVYRPQKTKRKITGHYFDSWWQLVLWNQRHIPILWNGACPTWICRSEC